MSLSLLRKKRKHPYFYIVFMMAFAILSWLTVNSSLTIQEASRSHISFAQGLKKPTRTPGRQESQQFSKSEEQKIPASTIEARFSRRRSRVQAACAHLKLRRNSRPLPLTQRFLFPTTTSPVVLYCPVPKTGSSFIRKVFSIANNMSAPYSWIQRYNKRPVNDYNTAVMFFFTRDPYSRLLSAYIDKLWSPNPFFWKTLGRNIIKKFRPNARGISTACGHDVTFPETVSYFIQGHQKRGVLNPHFTPTNQFCDVCNYTYDYIGKMETFAEDVAYILSAINITVSDVSNPARVYKAADVAFYAVFHRPSCTSKEEVLKRAWRGLQIRGLLSMSVKFPFPSRQVRNVTRKEFRRVLEKAARKSKADFVRRGEQLFRTQNHRLSEMELLRLAREQQRKEVLGSVYSLVPLADRHKMRELLEPEFELFGYEPKPEAIFSDEFKTDKDIFNLSTV